MSITLALMLSGMGISVTNIQMTLAHLGVGACGHHNQNIRSLLEDRRGVSRQSNFGAYRTRGVAMRRNQRFAARSKVCGRTYSMPYVGGEKASKVCGKKRWIIAVMRITSRFILAWDMSDTKEWYNA